MHVSVFLQESPPVVSRLPFSGLPFPGVDGLLLLERCHRPADGYPDRWWYRSSVHVFAGHGGIQSPRSRYQVIDLQRLAAFVGCSSLDQLQGVLRDRAEAALHGSGLGRSRAASAASVGLKAP